MCSLFPPGLPPCCSLKEGAPPVNLEHRLQSVSSVLPVSARPMDTKVRLLSSAGKKRSESPPLCGYRCVLFPHRRLGPALRDLETHEEALGIVSYGVFAPTMHDVFTRVCGMSKRSFAAPAADLRGSSSSSSSSPSFSSSPAPRPNAGEGQTQAEGTMVCTSTESRRHEQQLLHALPLSPSPPPSSFWKRGFSSDPAHDTRGSRLLTIPSEEKAETQRVETSVRRQNQFLRALRRPRSASPGRKSMRDEERREVQLVPVDQPRVATARRTSLTYASDHSIPLYRFRLQEDPLRAPMGNVQEGKDISWMRTVLEEKGLVCLEDFSTEHSRFQNEPGQPPHPQLNQDPPGSTSRSGSAYVPSSMASLKKISLHTQRSDYLLSYSQMEWRGFVEAATGLG